MIAFGEDFLAVRLWLALIGVLACGLVYWLGTLLFDRAVGFIAAALAAVSPTLAGFSVVVLSETTFAAAILLSLGLMARLTPAWASKAHEANRSVRWRLALMAGAAIALAVYIRPSWILAAPLFCAVLIGNARRRGAALIESIMLMGALLAALLPWAVRNQRATGHFVLTTLWSGPSLYDGLHPGADGGSNMTFFDRDRLMDRMSEYEMDQTYRRAAWRFAAENPRRTAELAAIKLWRYFKPWPSAEQFNNPWAAAAVGGFYIPLLLLASVGGWAHRQCVWRLLFTAGPLFYFAAIHTVFVSSLRYRLPAEYPLCILAAAGIQFIYSQVRKRIPAAD